MTRAGVTPLEPEHLGPQAGPSWAEGAGRHDDMLAHEPSPIDPLHELQSQMRGAVPPAESRPPAPTGRGGLRAAGALDSPLGSMALLVGFPPPASFLRAPPNPRMTAPSPDCWCRNGEVFRGQRIRERSQETQPWVFPLTYSL